MEFNFTGRGRKYRGGKFKVFFKNNTGNVVDISGLGGVSPT